MADDAQAYLGLRLKGRYLIEDHIGSGLSAHAFRAYDTLLQGRVVIKIIKNSIAGIPIDLGEEWKKESRKAMQVRGHPHIASILDLGEETTSINGEIEDIHFIVTEFIEGPTLRELESGSDPLSIPALLTIAQQLLGTLEYLQARKLSHDDLHSGNIMVSQIEANRPFIKIIDFGMASNTLIPKEKAKDLHFALGQLEALCQKARSENLSSHARLILEQLMSLLKKGQNFIPLGRMTLRDINAELLSIEKELASRNISEVTSSIPAVPSGGRIEVERRSRFCDRKTELARINQITTDSFLSKRGAMVVISGEAGIGKTRLVDEVLRHLSVERTRHLFLYHKCTQEVTKVPFASIFDAIIVFLDDIPGTDDEERLGVVLGNEQDLIKPFARLLSDYRTLRKAGISSGLESTDISSIPFLLVKFLKQAALSSPVLLFLDDSHLADEATIDFTGFLLKRIDNSPTVIITTYRPEDIAPVASEPDGTGSSTDIEHPLVKLLNSIYENQMVTQIELAGLEREHLDEILSNLYTFIKPSDFSILSDAVKKLSGGNPFYLFEITGLMEDEGYIEKRDENNWSLKRNFEEFAIPETINSLISRRINRLSRNEILLLKAAAVQGERFDKSILHKMFSPPNESIEKILNSLLYNHGLIKLREGNIFGFIHHQVHQAILCSLSLEDLENGHRQVAGLLEQQSQTADSFVPNHLIAYHYSHAGQNRLAAEYYLEAGTSALNSQQYYIAVDHLSNAAKLHTPGEESDDLAIGIALALLDSVKPLGERSLQKQAIAQLDTIAEKTGRDDLARRAMLEKCIFLRTISDHDKSLDVAEQLIKMAQDADDLTIEAIALKEAGTTSYLIGKLDRAEECFNKSADILLDIDDRSQLARVYNNLGLVCRNSGRLEEMIEYFNKALDIFRDVGDTVGERFPLGNLGIVYIEKGEFERAHECFMALKESLAEHADLMMEAKVDFSIGEIYLEVGLLNEAREACERALETFVTIGNRQGESEVLGTLGGIYIATGDLQLAREYFEKSLDVKRAIGNQVGILHSRITLARISNIEGRHEAAINEAKEVLEIARERSLRSIELECLTEMMHAYNQLDGTARALSLLGPNEAPEQLSPRPSAALVSFTYKVGELSFQAGNENQALKYIALAGGIVEDILGRITQPAWQESYRKKRERILDTYNRLKPVLENLNPDKNSTS